MVDKREGQAEKEMAIARAKAWWKERRPDRVYVCDGCNGPLKWNEEGSSLVGSWMRCKNCTDMIFANEGRMIHLKRYGRSAEIPLSDVMRRKEFSDKELLKLLADILYSPDIMKLRVKLLPNGDIDVF